MDPTEVSSQSSIQHFTPARLRLVATNSLLGGIVFGYNLGIAASFLGMIELDFNLNSFEVGVAASSALMGGTIGSTVAGHLADKHGRKPTLFLASIIGIVSALALSFTDDLASFSIVRAILGITVGLLTVVVPTYTAEATPDHERGTYGVIFQFAICLGFLLSYIVAIAFCGLDNPDECFEKDESSWRYQVGLGAIPCLMLFLTLFFLPESPRWKPNSDLGPSALESERSQSTRDIRYLELLSKKPEMVLGCILAATLQLTGINAILFFAPEIFEDAGIDQTILATLGIGIWNCIIVAVAMRLVDRVGRRPLFLTGVGLISISSFGAGIAFATLGDDKVYLAVISIATFMVGFQIGPGSLFFVVTAEIFDDQHRGKAVAVLNLIQWIFNLLLGLFFKTASDELGDEAPFFFFSAIAVLCWIYMHFNLRETKAGYETIA